MGNNSIRYHAYWELKYMVNLLDIPDSKYADISFKSEPEGWPSCDRVAYSYS